MAIQFLWQHYAKTQPNHTALRDYSRGVCLNWAQLNAEISHYAAQLQQYPQGAAVAISGKNNLRFVCLYLAALQCKMPVLGINPAFPQEKIEQLCRANQIALWLDAQQADFSRTFDAPRFPTELAQQGLTLTLTSGSSGTPKAVVHSMQQHLENAKGVCELMQFKAQDSWLLSLPLYHVSGQGIIWRWLAQGAELHLPSEDFYADVARSTHVSLVPTQALRLLDYCAECEKTAVKTRAVLLGGAHIAAEICQKLTALSIAAYCGYGMTEMASTVFAKQCDSKDGVGQPLSGREFQLVEEEVWLRGAGLGLGYWLNGKLQPLTNAQGWFATRDKGSWNGEQLQLQGRLDNMFISGGENIQPEEIENLMLRHSSVQQVFILPKKDPHFGARPLAAIAFCQPFSAELVRELQIWLADKIERFKQPIDYVPLPANVTQGAIKISRQQLKTALREKLGY